MVACAFGPWFWLVGHKLLDADPESAKGDALPPRAPKRAASATAGGARLGRAASAGALRATDSQAAAFSSAAAARFSAGPFYDVGGVLGEGAFGVVVRATSRQHKCECGLKIVEESKFHEREVSVHSGLDHPHIVLLLESFRHGDSRYIAVELCHGGELFTAVRARGRLPESDAKVLFRQIVSATSYMHSRAVAHRDLKLENFLLKKHGTPLAENDLKLIDFGFATRFVPSQRSMRTRCGSEGYVAPEILTGQKYDEHCDVFSCGVLLHCLLCGKMPFKDERHVLKGEVRFGGRGVRNLLSIEARRLIERALAKVPTDRPSSHDLLDAAWLLTGLDGSSAEPLARPTTQQPSVAPHPAIASAPSATSSASSGRLDHVFETLRSFSRVRSGISKRHSRMGSLSRSASSIMAGGRRVAHAAAVVAACAPAPRASRREPR